ncbi:(2Fe-2S)-binding protein [Methylobacterium nodulans]|uniref:Bacterioferritin-associated ferredoxin n=1 Tax=Methylobacterium nodulans (strain LMG 21967 / CNCM I-2342 / ORS 2060) TaxID=460265 RepID=B8IFC8_METNO|nr:(2Fe-2S)-binding protein [Methylobacterium nodulans]ACL57663.1 BFD domain protein (2Fe-2S)-binding domain protein [Methylobacterium nodulans ORS 2060]
MIVCSCNVLSDGAVRACLSGSPTGPRTPAQVYACLGCSPKCGRCARTIRSIMRVALDRVAHSCTAACTSTCSAVKAQKAEGEIAA